jgi:hypothetical protein
MSAPAERQPLPDSPYVSVVDAAHWLAFGTYPPPAGAVCALVAEGEARRQKELCRKTHQMEAKPCECPKGPDDRLLDQYRAAQRLVIGAHMAGKTSLIGRRVGEQADRKIPNEDFNNTAIDLMTGTLGADGAAEFPRFEDYQAVCWQGVSIETVALRALAAASSQRTPGLARREQRKGAILAELARSKIDPLSIPDGGKATAKKEVMTRDNLSGSQFEDAWTELLKAGSVRMRNHAVFARQI